MPDDFEDVKLKSCNKLVYYFFLQSITYIALYCYIELLHIHIILYILYILYYSLGINIPSIA